jgi:catechol 2,3-dioxygenase-like lactoylglutathione lyase family enzyme
VITGSHVIVYSKDAEADRTFFNEVFGFDSVDAGHGWLIFALPPAEVAFHPGDESRHELYLMCDNLEATMAELKSKGVVFKGTIDELRWGRLAHLDLPGGGTLGIYQPKHTVPSHRPITKD